MVSTRVCGTLSSGSNPDRHPRIFKEWNDYKNSVSSPPAKGRELNNKYI